MAKKVILAVAGAGKTYTLCRSINRDKRNLILAFTNQNIKNIKYELTKAYGGVPPYTKVMTFDSFLFKYLVCAYEPTILNHFCVDGFKRKGNGISLNDPPPQQIKVNGLSIPNPKYIGKSKFAHYITNNRYYCRLLSELIIEVNNSKNKLIERICKGLMRCYDHICIDEFQDFRKKNYELIEKICKKFGNDITLVGDFYQHSVSGTNNSGKPFEIQQGYISYSDYISFLEKLRFNIETTTLLKSRRCPASVCAYIKDKLNINIEADNNHYGEIIYVKEDNIVDIINNDNIVKLCYQDAEKYCFRSINWGYSKGDTYDNVCVILTYSFNNIDSPDFNTEKIKKVTLNKIYVAFTRTKGNLYIIKESLFKKYKRQYLIE